MMLMLSFVRCSVTSGTLPCFNFPEAGGHPPVPANRRGNHRQHGVSAPSLRRPFLMAFSTTRRVIFLTFTRFLKKRWSWNTPISLCASKLLIIAFAHVGIRDSRRLIFLPLSLSCSLTAATREITAGPKHTGIFILSRWIDPLLITQHTLARSQWKCGYYLSVRTAARTTFPLPSRIRP